MVRRVMVHTKSGRSLSGVLTKRWGRWMVLKQSEIHLDAEHTEPLDGEVWLDRDNVDFVQVLS